MFLRNLRQLASQTNKFKCLGSSPTLVRCCSSKKDELKPWEPYFDPEELKDVIGNKETEHFTFDDKKGILQEEEDEREGFQRYCDKFGLARFSKFAFTMQSRDFEVSKDPKEWEFVERLLPADIVPKIPDIKEFHSGFQPPKIKPGSPEAIKLGYFVPRSKIHELPVYTRYDRPRERVVTNINHCDGNLFKLRDDLDKFLYDRYKMKFNSRVAELYNEVIYIGDFEVDFKEFLMSKGL